jgi:Domain of unknown function (DUF1830)
MVPTSPTNRAVSDHILCYYTNATRSLQILKLTRTSEKFERLIFPNQRLLFEAVPDAMLEIFTSAIVGMKLLDQIPCQQIQVHQTDRKKS